MKNKKGNIGLYIGVVISLVLGIVILTSIAIPQWRQVTTSQVYTENLNPHVLNIDNTTTTLTYTDLESGTVIVSGLTLTSNYTVDYDTGIVTVLNATNNGTYEIQYYYYAPGYATDTGTKALAGVVVLFLIVGIVAGGLKMFGVI